MLSFDDTDSYLPIKLAAEYFFCQRAAFYMFTRWENDLENPFLYKGSRHHKSIENMSYKSRAKVKVTYREFVVCHRYKIYGVCDAVEKDKGSNLMYPVEYKTGRIRENEMHRAQLYFQAFCLEEMTGRRIPFGYIYFVESKARKRVLFSAKRKKRVVEKLHELQEKLRRLNVTDFKVCGSPHCSYYTIDHPVLY